MRTIESKCYACGIAVESIQVTIRGQVMYAPVRCEYCSKYNLGTPPTFVAIPEADSRSCVPTDTLGGYDHGY
jgi:hypothetical protein